MKSFVFTVFLLISIFDQLFSQQSESNKHHLKIKRLDIDAGFGGGYHGVIVGAGTRAIVPSGFGLSLSCKINSYKSANFPDDYYPARSVFSLSEPSEPRDETLFCSLTFLKEFRLGTKKWKIILEAGPSFNRH